MTKQWKHYSPEEKVAILRRHLADNEPTSKLCDEHRGGESDQRMARWASWHVIEVEREAVDEGHRL